MRRSGRGAAGARRHRHRRSRRISSSGAAQAREIASARTGMSHEERGRVPASDVDLLAILLGLDSITPAAALIDRFGSLARMERAGVAELMSIEAIDRAR